MGKIMPRGHDCYKGIMGAKELEVSRFLLSVYYDKICLNFACCCM